MKYTYLIFFFLVVLGQSFAQVQYDYNWMFGGSGINGTKLNFESDSLVRENVSHNLPLGSTNACISDKNGELLFYTNGCLIHNKQFEEMENGFGLNPGEIADSYCDDEYPSLHQSMLILPSTSNDSIYHVFHKRIIIDTNLELIVVSDSLFHTIIDISANNGLGKVIQKNKGINLDLLNNGFLTAVKRKNHLSWWIISGVRDSNKYEIYELTENDQIVLKTQTIGATIMEIDDDLQTLFSPDGNLFVRAFADVGIFLFDFDREIGEFSNPRHIPFEIEPHFGGAAISPNSRFLYVNSTLELFQFDLTSPNIEASKTLIATFDGYASPFSSTFYNAQLGPDCKIYYNSNNGIDVLHVMHNPNAKGTACNFEQHGIKLAGAHGISLPYFPSYRLDTDYPICDTTKLVATSIQVPNYAPQEFWTASPNPTSNICYLSSTTQIDEQSFAVLYDSAGKQVLRSSEKGQRSITLDLSNLASGIYFYQVIGKKGNVGNGKVVKE